MPGTRPGKTRGCRPNHAGEFNHYLVNAAHAEVFDFKQFLDAGYPPFAADADVRNLVTPAKAGAHGRLGSPRFAGKTRRGIALS